MQGFLNNGNHADTELGTVLWAIVRRPSLPDKPLEGSRISVQKHNTLLKHWQGVIDSKNEKGNRKGLSLDDFVRLVNSFYGYSEQDDSCVINRSALHRLIQTGNPRIEGFAKSINSEVLKIVAEFSPTLSYDELEEIGLRASAESKHLSKRDHQIQSSEAIAYPQTVKGMILEYVARNGYKSLAKKGISEADILELLFEEEPKVSLGVLLALPAILGITPETFLKLTISNQLEDDEDNQG